MNRALFLFPALVLSCALPALAAIDPIIRLSEVRASATAGSDTESNNEIDGHFNEFNEAVSAGAVEAGNGTASASAGQLSNPSTTLGAISATGGTATASTGGGFSSALSTFRYSFGVEGESTLATLVSAIAQTGAGEVSVVFSDISLPEPIFLARRFGTGADTGPTTAIEEITLLAGHFYDLEITASSPSGSQSTTSYTFSITPIPEPAMIGLLLPGAILLAQRRRPRR